MKEEIADFEDFRPDWQEVWTADQANKELIDFTFNGPGWYRHRADTLLVIPIERDSDKWGHHSWSRQEKFLFCVYNGRSPANSFNAIINLPTRE